MPESIASQYQQPLAAALRLALEHFQSLDHASVASTADIATLRRRLALPLADSGLPAEQVVAELAAGVDGGLLGSSGGRFFAWVIGGSLPASLAADWLTAAWEQNAAVFACSPAASVVEEVAGAWLKDVLGLPSTASFALVTGCQMAHVTCLAAARHRVLANAGWDLDLHGMAGAPPIRVLTSSERHATADRALRLLGIGRSQIEALPADDDGRLPPATLAAALAANSSAPTPSPTIVLLQAGDLNCGAYDDFAALIPLAHAHHAWVHVDGAFGLWAAASPAHRHLLHGAAAADSWATDGHKWLNVPYDCGYAFVADPAAHRDAIVGADHNAPYVPHHEGARDQFDWNPEWSRRARGFATYAALRQLGRDGLAAMIAASCAHARALVLGLGALDGAEVAWEPSINQGLVSFGSFGDRTDEVVAALNATGVCFFGSTTWRGRRVMRVSVCNWQTTADDVARTLAAAAQVLRPASSRKK